MLAMCKRRRFDAVQISGSDQMNEIYRERQEASGQIPRKNHTGVLENLENAFVPFAMCHLLLPFRMGENDGKR